MTVTLITPLFTATDLDAHVLAFLKANPKGARNSDVGRAIGYNDTRQWFSYGVLDRLIRAGKVRKDDRSLYYAVL